MKFENITDQAGVAYECFYLTGALFADVHKNGNEHLDLLVASRHGEIALYIYGGNENFERHTNSALAVQFGADYLFQKSIYYLPGPIE